MKQGEISDVQIKNIFINDSGVMCKFHGQNFLSDDLNIMEILKNREIFFFFFEKY